MTKAASSIEDQSNNDGLPAGGYVRLSELIPDPIPMSSATIWRAVKAGKFPKPVKLSQRITAWHVADVRAWMAQRAAGARQEAA